MRSSVRSDIQSINDIHSMNMLCRLLVIAAAAMSSTALFGCGQGFQTMASQAGNSISSSLSDNFGAVQMVVSPTGSEIQVNVGDTLNISVVVSTDNVIESASWQKLNMTNNTYTTVPNTTVSVDLSNSTTTDLLSLANIQTSASGTYRASVVVQSLDGTSTRTFTSDFVQIVVGGVITTPTPTATPIATGSALTISSALKLNSSTITIGQTLTETVTYTNNTRSNIAILGAVLAGRPPGGTNANGPWDDLSPAQGAMTIIPGGSLTITATRAFTSADPVGSWYSFPTYEDASGAWHDGPSTAFKVVASGGTTGTPAPTATPKPTATPMPTATPSGAAKRPSYNTGDGFFVLGGKLYDAGGNEFRMRGVNRTHWDSGSMAGINKSGANTERWSIDFTRGAANITLLQNENIANKIVPVPGNWDGTCKDDASYLSGIVDTWVAQASQWTALNKDLIVDIANEWGPSNSMIWRDSYITAVQRLRAAGYLGAIMIDSGGCGQDFNDLLNYSTAVFNSDPQKNIVFSLHVYGNAQSSLSGGIYQKLVSLGNSAGMVFIGEFGPDRNIGPSPTTVSPTDVVSAAEAAGMGWLAWAWDDNNLAGATANNDWFSMTYKGMGTYNSSADLTIFGQQMVEGCTNPTPGGCGCPDYGPVSSLTSAQLALVEPGCKGTPVPKYSPNSLKSLAKKAIAY